MLAAQEHLNEPITAVARRDVATLREDGCVGEALELIRPQGEALGEKVVYFYVVDRDDCLVGVLPTRRLLTSAPEVPLRDFMLMACLLGLSVPTVLHALRLDPKVAAGPVTLALTDTFTVFFYLGLATLLLAPA